MKRMESLWKNHPWRLINYLYFTSERCLKLECSWNYRLEYGKVKHYSNHRRYFQQRLQSAESISATVLWKYTRGRDLNPFLRRYCSLANILFSEIYFVPISKFVHILHAGQPTSQHFSIRQLVLLIRYYLEILENNCVKIDQLLYLCLTLYLVKLNQLTWSNVSIMFF